LEPTIIAVQGKTIWNPVSQAFDSIEQISDSLFKARMGGQESFLCSFSHPSSHFPLNWGANEHTPYLIGTVMPTVKSILQQFAGTRTITKVRKKKTKIPKSSGHPEINRKRIAGRSLIAEFYYNQEKYQPGCGTDLVVTELDKFWKRGVKEVYMHDLLFALQKNNPGFDNAKSRMIHTVNWAKKEGFLIKSGDMITIKP
jgi:hypothetical protein